MEFFIRCQKLTQDRRNCQKPFLFQDHWDSGKEKVDQIKGKMQ